MLVACEGEPFLVDAGIVPISAGSFVNASLACVHLACLLQIRFHLDISLASEIVESVDSDLPEFQSIACRIPGCFSSDPRRTTGVARRRFASPQLVLHFMIASAAIPLLK
jgi:hypothetical protein